MTDCTNLAVDDRVCVNGEANVAVKNAGGGE